MLLWCVCRSGGSGANEILQWFSGFLHILVVWEKGAGEVGKSVRERERESERAREREKERERE